MSTTEARDPGAPETGVPDAVTFREIQEIIRTFQGSGWRLLAPSCATSGGAMF